MEMVADNVNVTTKTKRDRRPHTSTGFIVAVSLVVMVFVFTFSYAAAWGRRMRLFEEQSSTEIFNTLNLETLDGASFTHENFKDAKVTLINVWGTDCAPCINELPELEALNHSYAPGEIQVVGLLKDATNGDGAVLTKNIDTAKKLCEKAGVTYPTMLANQEMFAYLSHAIAGTPTTFFFDSDGNVIKVVTGANNLTNWKNQVDDALAQIS